MPIERRNLTALGRKRRREFDRSVKKLRDLGMPAWAVEYYRRASRIAGLPPHMVVCHVAVVAAGRQMQARHAHEDAADEPAVKGEAIPKEAVGASSQAAPTYESVETLRRRVTGLWREIQRHGTLIGAAENDDVSADLRPEGFPPGTVTRLRAAVPEPGAPGSRSPRR